MTEKELDLVLLYARGSDIQVVREALDQLIVLTNLAHGEEIAARRRKDQRERDEQKQQHQRYADEIMKVLKERSEKGLTPWNAPSTR